MSSKRPRVSSPPPSETASTEAAPDLETCKVEDAALLAKGGDERVPAPTQEAPKPVDETPAPVSTFIDAPYSDVLPGLWQEIYCTNGTDMRKTETLALYTTHAISPDEQAVCSTLTEAGKPAQVNRAVHFSHKDCADGIFVGIRGVSISIEATDKGLVVTSRTPFSILLDDTDLILYPPVKRKFFTSNAVSQHLVVSCKGCPARIRSMNYRGFEDDEPGTTISRASGSDKVVNTTTADAKCFASTLSISGFAPRLLMEGHLQTDLLCVRMQDGDLTIPRLTSKETFITSSGNANTTISLGTVGRYHGMHLGQTMTIVPISDKDASHSLAHSATLIYIKNEGLGEKIVSRGPI